MVGVDLAAANAHDLRLAEKLLEDAKGWALGDRNYWSADLIERLGDEGLHLLAPYKAKKREVLAALADAKEAPDRNRDLSADRALHRQEGVGAGSLALNQSLLG